MLKIMKTLKTSKSIFCFTLATIFLVLAGCESFLEKPVQGQLLSSNFPSKSRLRLKFWELFLNF